VLLLANPKTCVGCGTTKTPQWREGPAGPKTLCNACGVRRYREKNNCEKAPKALRARVEVHREEEPLSRAFAEALPPDVGAQRGKRKAAERAMRRTQDLATNGEWEWEDARPAKAGPLKRQRQRDTDGDKRGSVRPGPTRASPPLPSQSLRPPLFPSQTASHASGHSITEEVEWSPSPLCYASRPSTLRPQPPPSAADFATAWHSVLAAPAEAVPSPASHPPAPYLDCTEHCSAAIDLVCLSSAATHPLSVLPERAAELSAADESALLVRG